MKRIVLLISAVLCGCALCAQTAASRLGLNSYDLAKFDGLKSVGAVPQDLRLTLDELYQMDIQRMRDYNNGKMRNRDEVLYGSFQISQLMASGRIVYGDPISLLAGLVADTLLKDYPDLRKELRFYTVKSPEVNAFATGQGMIFINTGLVAQLEDEAQLAFVISHEIIHYYKKHSLEMLSRKKTSNDTDKAERQLKEFLRHHNRSHEMENEADSLGIQLFYLNSPYDKHVADGFFDVLQYGYLPFDEIPFDTNYFNVDKFRLPNDYFLKEVAPISARDDYDDSKSTHPNLKKRRENTTDLLSNYHGGARYVITDEAAFHQIRSLARLECIRQNLIYANYVRAFYDCYVLEKEFQDNHFLTTARAQALYSLSKLRNATNTTDLVPNYKDYEGEVQQPYFLFRKLKNDELSLVAMREVWKAHMLFPNDAQLTAMAKDLLLDIKNEVKLDYASFSRGDDSIQAAADTTHASSRNQKYERIKKKRQTQNRIDMRRYAFVDFFAKDSSLEMMMRELERPQEEPATDYHNSGIITYCPTYLVVDKKAEKADIDVMKSAKGEAVESSYMAQAAKKLGLKPHDFSDVHLRNCATDEEYNEFVSVGEWCAEFLQGHGDVSWHLFLQPQMDQVSQKYNADMLALNLVLNIEHKLPKTRIAAPIACVITVVGIPLLPLTLYAYFAERESTLSYILCADTHTGKIIHRSSKTYNMKDSPSLIKSSLYNTLHKAINSNKK